MGPSHALLRVFLAGAPGHGADITMHEATEGLPGDQERAADADAPSSGMHPRHGTQAGGAHLAGVPQGRAQAASTRMSPISVVKIMWPQEVCFLFRLYRLNRV